jgi:dethiobiotin synthetase
VGNVIDPEFAPLQANIDTLRERLAAPCLGVIQHQQQPDAARLVTHLDLTRIIGR